ncbi:MAG: hypothetical protein FK730_05885 [Asgard group archaeon]|nr:hypothetical protein [Asgard group archaeon]
MSESEINNSVVQKKVKKDYNIVIAISFIFLFAWLFTSFAVGMRFYVLYLAGGVGPPNADVIVLRTMSSLFAVGSIVSGVLFGFSSKEHKTTLLITIFATIVSLGALSLCAVFGTNLIDNTQLIWIGVVCSSLTVSLIAFLTYLLTQAIKK